MKEAPFRSSSSSQITNLASEELQSQPIQDIENLLAAVNSYLQETEAAVSPVKEEEKETQEQKLKETENLMKMIRLPDGTVKYVKTEPSIVSSQKEPTDNVDEYEWEECADFEIDGCETFDVIEEPPSSLVPRRIEKKQTVSVSPSPVAADNAQNADVDESHLYEGLSEEEKLELMEVRKRYARVTAQQNMRETARIVVDITSKTDESPPTTVLESSDSSKIIALLEEKLSLLKEIELLKLENQKLKDRLVSIHLTSTFLSLYFVCRIKFVIS
jgi:hypothetical protein